MTEKDTAHEGISEARAKATIARDAARLLALTTTEQRNAALIAMADGLLADEKPILAANEEDVACAREASTPAPLIDRLLLDEGRLTACADALRSLATLPDPIGSVIEHRTLESGLDLRRIRVPLGVVAIVYEARPNVTPDAAGLCVKTANAAILRGGSLARRTNIALARSLSKSASKAGMPDNAILYIEDPSHQATDELMSLHGLIDVLIPRGGAGLIQNCVTNAKVPVIETGTGNCHIYLHSSADPKKAVAICVNAKTSRPGVCNAAESLLCDEDVAQKLLPDVLRSLDSYGVKLHCDEISAKIAEDCGISVERATDDDWGREYLDLEMSVKCVHDVREAIAHINRYGTGHSEVIVAEDEAACDAFQSEVDAAAVYANASTRFTDGGEFGLGAEIGISTQKLHVRGPMGLEALCSSKYVLRGDGQIR